jgi:hypothetical protein
MVKKCVDSMWMKRGRRSITCAKHANHMINQSLNQAGRSGMSISTIVILFNYLRSSV